MIDFSFEDISDIPISTTSISTWIDEIINYNNYIIGDLSFILCSDDFLLKINQQYLEHDYYTDVITFDYSESNIISGDIFISIDRVKDNAISYEVNFNDELLRIIIHGVLHLLGYEDKTKEQKSIMTLKEDEGLKKYRDVE